MSDPTRPPSSDPARGPAMPSIQRAAAPVATRLSAVWIVPFLALVISLGIAWKSYSDRGTLINITFDSASGLEPGQSVLKYRDVEVGRVEKVGFTEALDRVMVSVLVDKAVIPYIDAEARFWIVQPKIGFSGISGLDTVLSGVFIEGLWDEEISGDPLDRYAGLALPPLLREPDSGTWVTLSVADGGALIDGAPVLFRGIKVGELRNLRLSDDGSSVLMNAFIQAPYDDQLTTASVFWDTSGFSVSLDTSGIKLNVRSISSLVQGGVEFNTVVSGGDPILAEQIYQLYDNETLARESVFADTGTARVSLSILLDGSVRGLNLGDPVTYRGLKVGEVSNLAVQADLPVSGGRRASQRVDFDVSPERMGFSRGTSEEDFLKFLAGEVADGLRARVASTGLFGGGLVVELLPVIGSETAEIALNREPFPVFPSVAPLVSDFSATAEGLLTRVNKLPIEEVMTSATNFLDELTLLVAQDDTQAIPEAVTNLINELRNKLAEVDVVSSSASLKAALAAAENFMADLNAAGTVENIVGAMTDARAAADAVYAAFDEVPKLIENLNGVTGKLGDLPVDQVVEEARALVASLNTFVSSPEMAAVPEALSTALTHFGYILRELNEAGVAGKLTETMTAVQTAVADVGTATAKFPEVLDGIQSAIANANRVVTAYGNDSGFNTELRAMMRRLRDTAGAFEALARTLERNPQSLLLGR